MTVSRKSDQSSRWNMKRHTTQINLAHQNPHHPPARSLKPGAAVMPIQCPIVMIPSPKQRANERCA